MRSRPTGASAAATVTTGPCLSPTPIPTPLSGPSDIAIPLPNGTSGGGSFVAVRLPDTKVAINGRVAIGASIFDDEEDEASRCTCTTGTGGLGTSGIKTLGSSKRNGTASGWNKGSAITTPATAICKPTDAS